MLRSLFPSISLNRSLNDKKYTGECHKVGREYAERQLRPSPCTGNVRIQLMMGLNLAVAGDIRTISRLLKRPGDIKHRLGISLCSEVVGDNRRSMSASRIRILMERMIWCECF